MRPRTCQLEAARAALAELAREKPAGLVRMVTRSGKSIAMGLVLLRHRLPERSVWVVVTSRTLLVHDLESTFWRLLDPVAQGFSAADKDRETKAVRRAIRDGRIVGRCDGHRDRDGERVIVTTYPSLGKVLARLRVEGRAPILLLDEAHRAPDLDLPRIGWTATPHRGRGERLPFDRVIFEYGAEAAIRDGVIVPWERVELEAVADLASPLDTLDALIEMVTARGGGDLLGPGIVTAPNLTTAQAMAERMRAAGWPAVAAVPRSNAAPDGLTQQGMRDLLRRLGETGGVVVTVDWLAEGITLPSARWLGLCAAPRGRNHLCQVAGRIMGTCAPDRWGEKRTTLIFDPARILRSHKLEHPAMVGEEVRLPKSVRAQAREAVAKVAALPWAERVGAEERWTRALVEVCERAAGVPAKVPWWARPLEGPARGLPATGREWAALRSMAGTLRWVQGPTGERNREAIRAIIDGGSACAGTVRDLARALWLVRERANRALGRGVPMVARARMAAVKVEVAPPGVG